MKIHYLLNPLTAGLKDTRQQVWQLTDNLHNRIRSATPNNGYRTIGEEELSVAELEALEDKVITLNEKLRVIQKTIYALIGELEE
jgi:hypothetical protein